MSLRERVEQVLHERGAGRIRPAREEPGGYVVEEEEDGSVRLATAGLSRRSWILDTPLREASEILVGAGFEVEQAEDERGLWLRVRDQAKAGTSG